MDFTHCCAVVGSASFDEEHFLSERETGRFACVLAVDGGFASLERIGVSPDVALGDFDSLGYIPNASLVKKYPVMKDATDLELALDWALREGYPSAVIYGALGGRLDQTMATQQMLVHCARCGMSVAAVGEGSLITALSSHRGAREGAMMSNAQNVECSSKDSKDSKDSKNLKDAGDSAYLQSFSQISAKDTQGSARDSRCASLEILAGIEGILSVCAVGGDAKGVTEQGLLYEIENATLPYNSSLGISNQLTGQAAHIEVAEGDLLVFMPSLALSTLG